MKCPKCGMRDASVASSQPYCRNCMKSQPEWDEVVYSEIYTIRTQDGYEIAGTIEIYLADLVRKYFGIDSIPVRIKCRKGAILIERITTNKGVKNE